MLLLISRIQLIHVRLLLCSGMRTSHVLTYGVRLLCFLHQLLPCEGRVPSIDHLDRLLNSK